MNIRVYAHVYMFICMCLCFNKIKSALTPSTFVAAIHACMYKHMHINTYIQCVRVCAFSP